MVVSETVECLSDLKKMKQGLMRHLVILMKVREPQPTHDQT